MAKILIVEDSAFQRDMLKKALCKLGHETAEASNGLEGLHEVEKYSPDLILLDLLMPIMSGIAFLEKSKEMKNQKPIIVMTADIQSSTKEVCLNLGAVDVLNKPPKIEQLKEAIEKALSNQD